MLAQCNASAHAPPKMAIAVFFPHKSDTFVKKSYIAKEIYMPAKELYIPAKELYYRCYMRVRPTMEKSHSDWPRTAGM